MSVSYWGDLFYGINRIEHSELFDKDKERKIILKKIKELFVEEEAKNYEEGFYLNFESIDELDMADYISDLADFLKFDVNIYHVYCSNDDILYFGMPVIFPWEAKEIITQKKINENIYNAIKPILKDGITFEQVEPLIKKVSFNGADDYVTYYEY